jgi:phage gpG-like protein
MSRPLRDLPGDLAHAADRLVPVTMDALGAVLETAERFALENVSGRILRRRSGDLGRSIASDVDSRGGTVTGSLSAGGRGVHYARIHEMGGTIEGAPWLVFQLSDGTWRKVRRVKIPRRPYLRPAMEDALRTLGPELADHYRPLLSLEARR